MKTNRLIYIFIAFASLVVIAGAAFGWTLLRPMIVLPDEIDKDALDVRYAEAVEEYKQYLARDGIENYQLRDLLKKTKSDLGEIFDELNMIRIDCGDRLEYALGVYDENRAIVRPYLRDYTALVGDGLRLGSPRGALEGNWEESLDEDDPDTPHHMEMRFFLALYLFEAREAAGRGDWDGALQQMQYALNAAQGLAETHHLLNVMMGYYHARFAYHFVIEKLPVWPTDELDALAEFVRRNVMDEKALEHAILSDLIWFVEGYSRLKDAQIAATGGDSPDLLQTIARRAMIFVVGDRELILGKALTFKLLEAIRAGEEFDFRRAYDPPIQTLIAGSVMFNLQDTRRRVVSSARVPGAILDAIDHEKAFRAGTGPGEYTVEFGESNQITVNRDEGCWRIF
ncbi:hypothetical protein KDL45_01855 [bacterium]|nr:hypothetical protein [bacterium]